VLNHEPPLACFAAQGVARHRTIGKRKGCSGVEPKRRVIRDAIERRNPRGCQIAIVADRTKEYFPSKSINITNASRLSKNTKILRPIVNIPQTMWIMQPILPMKRRSYEQVSYEIRTSSEAVCEFNNHRKKS
jgi:hypothetical protein